MTVKRLWLVVVVWALAVLVAGGSVVRAGQRPATPNPPQLGSVSVVDLKALDKAITAHRGKPVLVNFWAIWCQPCVEELPEFLETGREARKQGGVALTVSYDLMVPDVTKEGVRKQMTAYVAEHRIDAPVLIYDGPDYDAINARFGLPGPVPATIAIDAAGRVVDVLAGKGTKARFDAMMRKARGQ